MPRDPYSFKPGDYPILVPRRLAVGVLNQLEMWQDVVTKRARKDTALAELIDELTDLLSDEE